MCWPDCRESFLAPKPISGETCGRQRKLVNGKGVSFNEGCRGVTVKSNNSAITSRKS